ncbi:MAG: thioredoxin domain-containing protein [Azospirillum sp.]|nr:thioredoxin domain-containing protein [Azospirillum sp.]
MTTALTRLFLALTLAVLCAASPVRAESPAFTDAQRTAIEGIIHDYLLANPEVLLETMTAYRARQEAAEAEARKDALVKFRDQLSGDPNSPVGGNPNGDVTLVEFFDYQCGYCKSVFPTLVKLIGEDSKLRFVYKEFPILSPASRTAAKAALAARAQGKYVVFHNALMAYRGQLSDEVVKRLAGSVGLDVARLERDMESAAVDAQITANHELASALDINGTPGFVIGGHVIPGAVDMDSLKKLIAAERKGS